MVRDGEQSVGGDKSLKQLGEMGAGGNEGKRPGL